MLTLLRNAELYAPEALGRGDLLLAGGRIAAMGTSLTSAPTGWPVEELWAAILGKSDIPLEPSRCNSDLSEVDATIS